MKEGLNSVTKINGELCVMTAGVTLMHRLCVDRIFCNKEVSLEFPYTI